MNGLPRRKDISNPYRDALLRACKVVKKDIEIDGVIHKDVPVKIYPLRVPWEGKS